MKNECTILFLPIRYLASRLSRSLCQIRKFTYHGKVFSNLIFRPDPLSKNLSLSPDLDNCEPNIDLYAPTKQSHDRANYTCDILVPTKHKPARTNPPLGSAYRFFGPTWRSPDHHPFFGAAQRSASGAGMSCRAQDAGRPGFHIRRASDLARAAYNGLQTY